MAGKVRMEARAGAGVSPSPDDAGNWLRAALTLSDRLGHRPQICQPGPSSGPCRSDTRRSDGLHGSQGAK